MPEMILPALVNQARQLGVFGDPVAERQGETKRQEQLMWSMKTIGGLLERNDLAPSSRENIQRTLLGIYGSLPDTLRPGAEALLKTAHLSPEEMRLNSFRAANPAPQPPTDMNGVPLGRTVENEGAWASYLFDAMAHKKAAMTHAFGKESANQLMQIPKLLQVSPESKTLWAKDEQTGMTMPLPLEAMGVDLKKATERGWTMAKISLTGSLPIADYKDMVIGGIDARVAPIQDLTNGKQGFDIISYGEAEPKAVTKPVHDAFVAAAMGKVAVKNLSGAAKNLAQFMLDMPKKFDSPEELDPYLQNLEQLLRQYDPSLRVFPNLEKAKGRFFSWVPGVSKYATDDLPFTIVPTRGKALFRDTLGNSGELHLVEGENGQTVALDNQGQIVPGSQGMEEGATLSEVTFAVSEIPEMRQGTIGDFFSNIQDILKPETREEVLEKTRSYVDLVAKEMDLTKEEIFKFDKEAFLSFVRDAVESAQWPLDAYFAWARQFEAIPIPGYKVKEKK